MPLLDLPKFQVSGTEKPKGVQIQATDLQVEDWDDESDSGEEKGDKDSEEPASDGNFEFEEDDWDEPDYGL